VALVTGGARGLGVEVCRQLAQAGMRVWCAARDLGRAECAADSLSADGEVRAAQLDVADESSITALVPEGARSITWACLLPDDGPTGGFFRDGQPLPW
jgi:NAD(P)-dependent dehydrogenase (short-subunit alcohol dehydrogenase family)